MSRNRTVLALGGLAALVLLSPVACAAPIATPTPDLGASPTPPPSPIALEVRRPNFLLIISDDQRYDTMDYMSVTRAQIFEQGVTFTRAYVTTPL